MRISDPQLGSSSELANIPAIVLVGGLGTRLRNAYSGPKAMAPVRQRPFLEYLVAALRRAGIHQVVLCVGYKRSPIQRHFRSGRKWGTQISYSVETKLLGTAGAVRQAWKMTKAKIAFVLNGDTYLNVDFNAMLRFHLECKALATVALVESDDAARYGTVELDHDSRITRFAEKQSPAVAADRGLINGGVYLFDRSLLGKIPDRIAVSLEKEVFPKLPGQRIYGFVTKDFFIDIGIPEDLRRASAELPRDL